MFEQWKPVPGYEGLYLVSSLGHFRRHGAEKLLAVTISPHNGYGYVRLSKAGKARNYRAHRLVLRAFVGDHAAGQEARHLNGTRSDNKLENLRWVTKIENKADQEHHGTSYAHYSGKFGMDHPNAKLTDRAIGRIKELLVCGCKQSLIADLFGVDQATVSRINTGNARQSKEATARAERRL